ncbi:hypothetical protein, partial [Vibrio parahaemolyticus]|uniref:hypothetical protein n=1 Tax=Vibrio parahaemolyticus TaxID=670 RepID=UPI001A8E7C4A
LLLKTTAEAVFSLSAVTRIERNASSCKSLKGLFCFNSSKRDGIIHICFDNNRYHDKCQDKCSFNPHFVSVDLPAMTGFA